MQNLRDGHREQHPVTVLQLLVRQQKGLGVDVRRQAQHAVHVAAAGLANQPGEELLVETGPAHDTHRRR